MGYKKNLRIFDEENQNQELEVYVNEENRVFINVGEIDNSDTNLVYTGWITLSKEDVQMLISELKELQKLI